MAEVQWGILGDTAQLGNTFLKAYEAGNSMRIAKGKESALARYATDPEGAASELMRYDPEAALTLQKETRGQQAAADRRRVLGSYEADPQAARRQAMQMGDTDLVKLFDGMDEKQQAKAIENGQQLYLIVNKLKTFGYEQRKAALQRLAPALQELGMDPAQVASADPTDAWIDQQKVDLLRFQKAADRYTIGRNVVEIGPDGNPVTLYSGVDAALEERGFRRTPDGNQTYIKGSAADPRYQGDAADERRAPPRARVGRAGSGGGLPPGFELE